MAIYVLLFFVILFIFRTYMNTNWWFIFDVLSAFGWVVIVYYFVEWISND